MLYIRSKDTQLFHQWDALCWLIRSPGFRRVGVRIVIWASWGHLGRLVFLCMRFAAALFCLHKKEQQLNLIISPFCVSIPALATWHLFAWWAFTCKVNKVSACQKQLFSFEIYFPMESLKIFKLLMRALKLGLKYIIRRNITTWRIAMIHILATSNLF